MLKFLESIQKGGNWGGSNIYHTLKAKSMILRPKHESELDWGRIKKDQTDLKQSALFQVIPVDWP